VYWPTQPEIIFHNSAFLVFHSQCFILAGTCVNNTSIMMFKKGSFEIGRKVYPVAIKVIGVWPTCINVVYRLVSLLLDWLLRAL